MFELMDAAGQCRLRQPEAAGRSPQTSVFGDRRDIAELIELHERFDTPITFQYQTD
jgi:hypothetical protein